MVENYMKTQPSEATKLYGLWWIVMECRLEQGIHGQFSFGILN
jgi:hypothetical protein